MSFHSSVRTNLFDQLFGDCTSDAEFETPYAADAQVDLPVFSWHQQLLIAQQWLPFARACRQLALTLCLFGAFALFFSGNRLTVGFATYQFVAATCLVVGFAGFSLCSVFAFYFKLRKAYLSRQLYVVGYRMTEDGVLVTNEPNPWNLRDCSSQSCA